ncbi:radial spoke head 10 homolog B isoform X7 [Phyllopteryx taeniolatus]|uniref:radial spoke head 10 homolog B isoform X7 n=1 Tax=Phyllopteryx taeniolatus TaxID=161469 RepID=UPI002AD4E500|nr:radial spoke head 10 homolog B isoform X7 [Phyllopteryx taeniolatus]
MIHGSSNLVRQTKQAHFDGDEQHDDGLLELPSFFVLTFQRYEGETREGQFHGRGSAKFKGGHTYKGMFSMGVMHGTGVFTWADKVRYEGEFVHNMPVGQGKYTWPDGSSYEGDVCNGVRHGSGTHKSGNVTYKGQWNHSKRHGKGYRHGPGIFYYAGGAVYEGGWQDNKKHGKGKVTLKDGYVFQGQFLNDKMVTPNMTANQAPVLHGMAESSLGPDMTVSIDCALEKIPGRKHEIEHKQVRFVLLRHKTELRSIYRFYSRLGQPQIPGGAFLLSRMQLWRLLKDCYVHHRGVTLAELDLYIRDNPEPAEVHSPFTPIMLCRFLSCLVIIAFHIYHEDMESSNHLLAACFSKLLIEDIFPHAKNVKGFLFKPPERTIVAVDFLGKCWKVYQAYCRVNKAPRDDSTMTNRHILWMYKDLNLYDSDLTIVRVMEIISAETLDPSNLSACMENEITFLEFFEALLGCGEVKCQQMTGPYPKIGPSRSSSALARQWQQTLAQDRELDAWSHKIHHFFKHMFFPAVALLHIM